MKNEDHILRLVEKENPNRVCSLFNHFHEKFESRSLNQIIVTTKEQFDCASILLDCLDKSFFENDYLQLNFNKFWQNGKFQSITYAEFQTYDNQEPVDVLLQQLLVKSEEIRKQTSTVIIKLPTTENLYLDFEINFDKFFISCNSKDENFLILTNSLPLIELYETL